MCPRSGMRTTSWCIWARDSNGNDNSYHHLNNHVLCAYSGCGSVYTRCYILERVPGPANPLGAKILKTSLPSTANTKRKSVLSTVFLDPNTFPCGRDTYYNSLSSLVFGSGRRIKKVLENQVIQLLVGFLLRVVIPLRTQCFLSLREADYRTSIIVLSDSGIWLGLFWETDKIGNAEGFQNSLNFFRKRAPGFPSPAWDVFVKAIVRTPNFVQKWASRDFPIPDRGDRPPGDAVWYPQIDAFDNSRCESTFYPQRPFQQHCA